MGAFQEEPEGDEGAADDAVGHGGDGLKIPDGRGVIGPGNEGQEHAAEEHGRPHNFHGAVGL